jgi:guanine nucleotide-exchange factor
MAEAGGAFVTRSFKRMLNDAPGRKYSALQTALKAYLERKPELPPPPAAVHHEEAAAVADEIHVAATTAQETSSDGEPSTPKEEAEIKSMDNIIISPVLSPGKPSTGQAAAATLAEAGHTLEGSEADLVILPLLLAFETKQSKLIETALDCLHVSCCKKIDSEKNTLSHHAY